MWPPYGQYLTSKRNVRLLDTISKLGPFSRRQWRPSVEVRVLFLPGGEVSATGSGEGMDAVPSLAVFGMWPGSATGATGDSPHLCVAAHSSPGGRPALEAQRKPRLSEAESGVLPILPPEKGRENGHLLRKGPRALPNSPAPAPRACCGLGRLGTGGGAYTVWCVRVGPEGVPFLGERGKKGPWVEEVRVVLRD